MFTIRCTTCSAKLAVKDDNAAGQIHACPQCGGMVLIQKPDETDKLADALKQDINTKEDNNEVFIRFPNPLERETDSGIIHPEQIPPKVPIPPPVPDALPLTQAELKTRKLLLAVLAGLLILLAAVVVYIIQHPNPQPQETLPDAPDVVETTEQPVVPPIAAPQEPELAQPPVEKQPDTPTTPDASQELARLLAAEPPQEEQTEPAEPAESPPPKEIPTTSDILSEIEKKMPGLMEPAAVLHIDIPQRLAIPLQKLSLQETPLYLAVRKFSQLTEIPITLDMDELRCRSISSRIPITKQLDKGTAGELLQQILQPLHLEPVIEDRQILITVPKEEKEKIIERKFDVSDLLNAPQSEDAAPLTADGLAAMLCRLINVTEKELRVDGSVLVMQSRLRVLDEAQRVLEQLRVVLGLPQTTDIEGAMLAPEAFCWDVLVEPMTLNYYEPVPLADVLEQMEAKTKLTILVDYKSLNRAMAPMNTLRGTVQCNRGTVNEALEKLLASVESAALTFRIVEGSTIEITTKDAARLPDKMSVEVHRYPADTPTEDLLKSLYSAFEPGRWFNAADAETVGFGDIISVPASECLFVRQSQFVQRQIRLWLGKRNDNQERE